MQITSLYMDKPFKFFTAQGTAATSTVLEIDSAKTLTIEIWGAVATKTLNFEQRGIGSQTWYPINGVNTTLATPAAAISTTSTVGEIWTFDITGVDAFRLNLTAVTGGTVSAQGKVSLL